ncbi:ankyrin repeat and protein kinase domain-containing protein [Holotrichia oblita]|uniref:Ankyrin repeat and protein kinase domain-containing protein n=1 Tax=Holotrichia oblita TaxID=644536 RepID=A0ACB9SHW6_HOLOL|nr:ankyrin repeat and protein kinase domain-containing protein [Holotrichia oblita]
MVLQYFRMPTECITNPLQRELADSIIRMVPLDEIRILLACGAKVNEPVTQGLMPLHYAVWQRYYEAVLLLLTRGGDVNAVDECGYSPLHLSAEHGFTEVVRLLLQSGAKVDYRADNGDEFPRTTLCDEPLRLAIRNKHMDVARLLLEHGANPNKRYFFGSEINLITDLEYLELLLTFGANPDSRDRSGLTPLMKAARQPHGMSAVLLLIKYGADVNAMADSRHDYRTVSNELLFCVIYGVSHAIYSETNGDRYCAAKLIRKTNAKNVLHYAVLSGNLDIVNLLIKQGAKLNYDDAYDIGKPSPLDLAILKGDPVLVSLLIKAGKFKFMLLREGADPNLKVYNDIMDRNSQLRPVLVEYIASNENPNLTVVNLLLRYGARVIMKTQFRDPDGMLNSLQNVISSQSNSIFFLLVEACESFDVCMIRRNNVVTPEQKTALLQLATTPLSLRRQVRLLLRKCLGRRLIDHIEEFELPKALAKYLLFDYSRS